jgi:5-methylcytosine-specific restriction endonuclease McrA
MCKRLSNSLRRHVFERDGGCCRLCGRDLAALEAEIVAYLTACGGEEWIAREYFRCLELDDFFWRFVEGKALWECDHILPRAEWGETTLENLRLACLRCHRRETAKLAGRRAIRRARHAFVPVIPEELQSA